MLITVFLDCIDKEKFVWLVKLQLDCAASKGTTLKMSLLLLALVT